MTTTTARVRPHKDMTPDDLRAWRARQAGDFAYARNQRRPGWNQRRAAHWYGVSERQWNRYENGESPIPLSLVKRLIAYETSFDQTVDRLFDTTPTQLEDQDGIFPEMKGRE
jgi:hypothetical protein